MLLIHRSDSTWANAAALLALTILAAGCASSPKAVDAPFYAPEREGAPSYSAGEVDTPPHLIKCFEVSGPAANNISGVVWEHVTVGYVVNELGQVDPATIVTGTTRGGGKGSASAESIREARARAATCTYTPGKHGGVPVRVRVQRLFRILANP